MVGLRFDLKQSLRDFNMEIALPVPNGVTALIGPNGSGKTTLLQMLSGLQTPDAGSIRLAGETLFDAAADINLHPQQRRVGMVFQDFSLFPHLDVKGNIVYGLKARGVPRQEQKLRVGEILERTGLKSLSNEPVGSLSGGQRQKVALARSLVVTPSMLLLDEPTAALDQDSRWEFRRWLADVLNEVAVPTLLVTHDPADVSFFRDRIAVLEAGRITQQGSYCELLHAPATPFIANFTGVNYISGAVVAANGQQNFLSDGGLMLTSSTHHLDTGKACLTVFPWEIVLCREQPASNSDNLMRGTVTEKIQIAGNVRFTVQGKETLIAEISSCGIRGLDKFQVGETVYAQFMVHELREFVGVAPTGH